MAIWCLAFLLVLAGCWVYSTSFEGVFVGDDIEAIADNSHLQSLWPLSRPLTAAPDSGLAGRPVTSLTLALNRALAPADAREVFKAGIEAPRGDPADPIYRNVWGYHAFNLGVHLASALLLFGVVRRTLESAPLRARFGPASTPLAFGVSLLWLVHPLQTESVTYVVQRLESLMGLFFLLTVYSAIRSVEADRRSSRYWWTAASVAACAFGMGSKESMVSAPIVVAVWMWIFRPDERPTGPAVRPLLAGLAATWIVLAVLVALNPRSRSVGIGLGGWTWWSYLQTQAAVVVHYLRLSFFPAPLVFMYDWPPAISWIAVAPPSVLLLLLAVLTVVAIVRRHPLGVAGAWFFLSLAPTSSVLPIATEVAAEHRMYLPLAAVTSLVVLGAYLAGRRVLTSHTAEQSSASRLARVGAWIALVAAAVALGATARARNRDYWSNEAILADTVRKRPSNAEARIGLGVELLEQGRASEAESQLRMALTLPPRLGSGVGTTAAAHMYLGSVLCAQNKLDEGIPHLEQALALNPRLSEAHGFLAEAYVSQGRYSKAAASFEQALAGLPDLPPLLHRAAWFYATAPDPLVRSGAKAAELAERAVRLTAGRNWMMLDVLGVANAEQGKFAEAVSVVQRALALAHSGPGAGAVPELQQHLALFEAGRPLRSR